MLELIRVANPELELEELVLELPRVAAATAPEKPPLPEDDELDDEPVLEPVEPLVEIDWPGETLSSDAIVPLEGA